MGFDAFFDLPRFSGRAGSLEMLPSGSALSPIVNVDCQA
jgi:hypothetical protein